MTNSIAEIIEKLNNIVNGNLTFLHITRCSELQIAARETLTKFRQKILEMKSEAAKKQNEELANILLGYRCVVDALLGEIEMWLLLKREEPDEAWDKLVDAQKWSTAAARAHEGFSHLVHHHRRLEMIEELLFPPQVFVSAGMRIKHQECSICGREYEDCEHLKGMPYMGEFCNVIISDVELDHVGIVESPADKSCRITEFQVNDGVRNRMTWRVEAKETPGDAAGKGELGFHVTATILRSGLGE